MTSPRPTRRFVLKLSCLAVGCGSDPNANLSPTPEQDPARYEEALRVAEEARQKSRELERTQMRRMSRPPSQGRD